MTLITTAVASKVLEAENNNVEDQLLRCSPDIRTLRATSFDDLLASEEVIAPLALLIGECKWLLGGTLEDITMDTPGTSDPSAGCDEQGAAAVVAAEELL